MERCSDLRQILWRSTESVPTEKEKQCSEKLLDIIRGWPAHHQDLKTNATALIWCALRWNDGKLFLESCDLYAYEDLFKAVSIPEAMKAAKTMEWSFVVQV